MRANAGCTWQEHIISSQHRAEWCTPNFRAFFESQTKHYQVSAAHYVSKRLLNIAVTGREVLDTTGTKHRWRRELSLSVPPLPSNEDCQHVQGYDQVIGIVDYKPPWEAICDERCGLYQESGSRFLQRRTSVFLRALGV